MKSVEDKLSRLRDYAKERNSVVNRDFKLAYFELAIGTSLALAGTVLKNPWLLGIGVGGGLDALIRLSRDYESANIVRELRDQVDSGIEVIALEDDNQT